MIGGVLFSSTAASAQPIFQSYFQQIRESLPPNYEMRLPSDIILTAGPGLDANELIVKLMPTKSPPRLTIGLFTCESSPFPCLVGGISVESSASGSAQQQLNQHRLQGDPITLAPGVRGYLRDGSKLRPASEFSSLMWQQDGMIYTLSFLAAERQNILTMGRSMAMQVTPLQSVQSVQSVQPAQSVPQQSGQLVQDR
jgi:hypothetical protein